MNALLEGKELYYHGSDSRIKAFNLSMIGQRGLEKGVGVYLTSSASDAGNYGSIIHVVEVDINDRRLLPEKKNFKKTDIEQLIRKSSSYEDRLSDWGDDPEEALEMAIDTIYSSYSPNMYMEMVETVGNEFYDSNEEFLKVLISMGYDGKKVEMRNNVTHLIWFNESNLKILGTTDV